MRKRRTAIAAIAASITIAAIGVLAGPSVVRFIEPRPVANTPIVKRITHLTPVEPSTTGPG